MSGSQATALYVCGAVAIGVFLVMIASIVAFHRTPRPADAYSQSTLVDLLWSLVPIAIIVGLVLPAAHLITRQ